MTDEQDIFTVGEEYTSEDEQRWLCIAKSNEFAWLRGTYMDSAIAYVWRLNGENVSQSSAVGYDIKPVKTMTLYGGYDGAFEYFDNGPATTPNKKDTHKITFKIVDGQPDCASIRMERIDAD